MKKVIFVALFVFYAFLSYGSVYSDIANSLASKMHTTEGVIVSVEKNKITLNKGLKDGLYKNSLVYIYRDVGSLRLFGNNKIVSLKKGVAYAYVSSVSDNESKAVISSGIDKEKDYLLGLGLVPWGEKKLIGKPKVNDKFIAGKKEYRVAIITRNPLIYSSLKSALEKTGRFYVINEDDLAVAMTKKRINSIGEKAAIKKLAEAVDADLVLTVSASNKYNTLTCKVHNGYAGNVIFAEKKNIDKESKDVLVQNKGSSSIPANNLVASNLRLTKKLTFWESILNKTGLYSPYTGLDMSSSRYKIAFYKEIGYGTNTLYVGNINNKSEQDILVAQGSKISIYLYDIDSFIKKGNFSYGYNIINIDSARIDGKTLVAISNFNRYGALDSAVGYVDKDYKFHIIKKNIPYHIRFYNKFSNPMLIAEGATITKPFDGKMYLLDINSNTIKRMNLPVDKDNFYNFEKIDNYIIYASKSGQLCMYDIDKKKITYKTAYAFGGGERAIQRYDYEGANDESIHEIEKRNNVYIKRNIVFSKEKDGSIYILGLKNYLSQTITIQQQHYNAYNLKLLRYQDGKLEKIWSSGDVRGRVVGIGKIGDYVISVIGLPAGFFDSFIRGIDEVDRLVAGEIKND